MIESGIVKVLPTGYEAQAHPEKPKCETCKGSGVVDDTSSYCARLEKRGKICDECYGTGVKRD